MLFRSGSVSLARAIRLMKENERTKQTHLRSLHDYLRKKLAEMSHVYINTPVHSAPHIMNISVPGIKPEIMIHMLAEKKVYISTKSACSSKEIDESRILAACGYPIERTSSALRISLSYKNTLEELEVFIKLLQQAIQQLI